MVMIPFTFAEPVRCVNMLLSPLSQMDLQPNSLTEKEDVPLMNKIGWLLKNHKIEISLLTLLTILVSVTIKFTRDVPWLQNSLQVLLVLPWSVFLRFYGDLLAQRMQQMNKAYYDAERSIMMFRVSMINQIVAFSWIVFGLGWASKYLLESLFNLQVGYHDTSLQIGVMKFVLDQVLFSFFVFNLVSYVAKHLNLKRSFTDNWQAFKEDILPRQSGLRGVLFSGGIISVWFIPFITGLIPIFIIFWLVPSDLMFIPIDILGIAGAVIFSTVFNQGSEGAKSGGARQSMDSQPQKPSSLWNSFFHKITEGLYHVSRWGVPKKNMSLVSA